MHFFYLDESGDTGANLGDADQPIFALGGISVRDEGWNRTQEIVASIFADYFDGEIPGDFELHSTDLLCRFGEGAFAGHEIDRRLGLVRRLLAILDERSHDVHLFAVKKDSMSQAHPPDIIPYNPRIPYLCGFDYMITYINWHVKENLGPSARALMVIDEKDEFREEIETIVHSRRFVGPATHRVKWLVEFAYPIDSKKNPMVQLSDLIVLCSKRFLEIEHGYRDDWPIEVKKFYAECYALIHDRIKRKRLIDRSGRGADAINRYLSDVRCEPIGQWKRRYDL